MKIHQVLSSMVSTWVIGLPLALLAIPLLCKALILVLSGLLWAFGMGPY